MFWNFHFPKKKTEEKWHHFIMMRSSIHLFHRNRACFLFSTLYLLIALCHLPSAATAVAVIHSLSFSFFHSILKWFDVHIYMSRSSPRHVSRKRALILEQVLLLPLIRWIPCLRNHMGINAEAEELAQGTLKRPNKCKGTRKGRTYLQWILLLSRWSMFRHLHHQSR